MVDRQEDSRGDSDSRVNEESPAQAIAKEEERAYRGNEGLNIENHIYDGWISVLQGHGKEDGPDCRAREGREDQVTPSAGIDRRQSHQLGKEDRQEHY